MKFNWGWGIMIFIVLFMAFILNLVYKCSRQQVDLVSENYYNKEINYQQQIDRENNSAGLKNDIVIRSSINHMVLEFPPVIQDPKLFSGEIAFFKPDDASQDFVLPIRSSESFAQEINTDHLKTGWWNIKVEWAAAGTDYFFQKRIYIN